MMPATATDSLSLYYQQVNHYPTLTRDEERRLTKMYARTKDRHAFDRLVTGNLRLVLKIARQHCRDPRRLADLIQEGNVGLLIGIRKFDPRRGTRLSTYVAPWIRAFVLRAVIADLRLVRIGTNQSQRRVFFHLRRERARLERQGREADTFTLARRFHMSETELAQLARHLDENEVSLDAPLFADNFTTLADTLGDVGETSPDALLARKEMLARVNARIDAFEAQLPKRNRYLFHQYWRTDPHPSLQQLGDRFGISRERVRQIVRRDLQRLRAATLH